MDKELDNEQSETVGNESQETGTINNDDVAPVSESGNTETQPEKARAADSVEDKADGNKKRISKKMLIRIISISAAAVVAVLALTLGLVFGLRKPVLETEYKLVFEKTEHVQYESKQFSEEAFSELTVTVKKESMVTFSLVIDDGYTDNSKVAANGETLSVTNGVYSVTVTSDTTIIVSEVSEIAVSLSGNGTQDSPFLITNVGEINYMASMVNAGNTSFVLGYYRLENDIDCRGARIEVTGNGNYMNAFFGGYFDGNGHTISNYVIESHDASYAGLFGYVQASGTGDGSLGTIINLNLKDFTVNAYAPSGRNVCVGSFAGYGVAANLVVCSAVNGTINVYGNNYFCYAGGAIGIQQSATTVYQGNIYPFYSAVNYVHTDVDIYVGTGYMYAAGGISGYVYSDHEIATAMVTNSYSEGRVFGAMRSGGIVGFLGNYSSISNCYSTGEIEAVSLTSVGEPDYDAYAGGIAGFAGYNTVITDSFSTADTYAHSSNGADHMFSGAICASYSEATLTERALIMENCYSGSEVKATSADFVKNSLKWNEVDWVISDGVLPVINREENEDHPLNVTVNFGGNIVGGINVLNSQFILQQNTYIPLYDYFLSGNLSETYITDSGLTSYGYYFDSQLKNRVPYGYVITKDVTFYVGFADYGKVEGTYYYNNKGRTVSLLLKKDGTYTYTDGISYSSAYYFDGEKIFFADSLFARLSSVIVDDSPNYNYDTKHFIGVKQDGNLEIYDGVYFVSDKALTMVSDAPVTEFDEFKGVWEKSATINKIYTFDGNGGWTYAFKDNTVAGTYTVKDGVAEMTKEGGVSYASAEFDKDSGLLIIDGEFFCLKDSMFGTWFDQSTGNYIRLEGYASELAGEALVSINSATYGLNYVKDGFFGENSITLLDGPTLFGYLIFDENENKLKGVLYNSSLGGYSDGYEFCLIDNYTGEWIGQDSVGGSVFELLEFNGFGLYEVEGDDGVTRKSGYVVINGLRYDYTVNVENGLDGSFIYEGIKYDLSYDDDTNTVKVTYNEDTASFIRKDELYRYTLIDDEDTVYSFNGGGTLSNGGKLTATKSDGSSVVYGYKIVSCNLSGKVLSVKLLDGYNGNETGEIGISGNKFTFNNGNDNKLLDIYSPFTGTWAISFMINNFNIGRFDLSYTATGRFSNMSQNAEYEWFFEDNYIRFSYITEQMTSPTYMYLLLLDKDNIAVASNPYMSANDNIFYAARQDELYGFWYDSNDRNHTLQFDGLADSKYTVGYAFDSANNITYNYTRRFGKLYIWRYDDENAMYVLTPIRYNLTGENIYNNGGRLAYRFDEFNPVSTPVITAVSGETEYALYLDGTFVSEDVFGTYELVEVTGNITRVILHVSGQVDRTADVDYATGKIVFIG